MGCESRPGQFIADIFFQALQFRDVTDIEDEIRLVVERERPRRGYQRVRRTVKDAVLEERRLFEGLLQIGEHMLNRIRRLGKFQEMMRLGIEMSNIPLFIINNDPFVYVIQYGGQKGNLVLFAPVQEHQIVGVLIGR